MESNLVENTLSHITKKSSITILSSGGRINEDIDAR